MKVLVVDDEADVRNLVSLALRREGYEVVTACDGADALSRARTEHPGLVVLDLMLPTMEGFAVRRALREEADIPVLMLTGRSDEVDTVTGLDLGPDDYLAKPFKSRELVARVRAILRRVERAAEKQTVFRLGKLQLDTPERTLRIDGVNVPLRAKEFDLLLALVKHKGEVMRRERLLELVWGYGIPGKTRTVDVHVYQLRKRLAGSGVAIKTLRGVGYKLVRE
jgi:DNA-binding response OmpR family regulator